MQSPIRDRPVGRLESLAVVRLGFPEARDLIGCCIANVNNVRVKTLAEPVSALDRPGEQVLVLPSAESVSFIQRPQFVPNVPARNEASSEDTAHITIDWRVIHWSFTERRAVCPRLTRDVPR